MKIINMNKLQIGLIKIKKRKKQSKFKFTNKQKFLFKRISKYLLIYFSIMFITLAFNFRRRINLVYTKNEEEKKTKIDSNLAKGLKIALCTMGRKENLYVKEFVDYYIKLGVEHLFIYDHNLPNTEKISDEIESKYKDKVTVYDNIKFTKKIDNQLDAFTDCYQNNYKNFDWFLMVDMDEFIYIVDDTLKNYLISQIFDKCDFIKIHWAASTDNGNVYYDNRTLLERFKSPYIKMPYIKTLVRGNISELKYYVHSPYYSPRRNVTCTNFGKKIIYKDMNFQTISPINVDKAFIIHFRFKSTEELVNKYKRGYNHWRSNEEWIMNANIAEYFEQSKLTLEKIHLIEKMLNKNLIWYKIYYFFTNIFYFWILLIL